MTEEKAIDIFNDNFTVIDTHGHYIDEEVEQARQMAIKALEQKEQESCEDEYIKVPKNALKYRAAGIVAYNIEWLKKHFDMERSIIFGELVESKVDEMKPTEKQIKYAQYLAERMCQELPKDFTKEAYSEFISKWKPAVLEEDKAMNESDA